MARFDHVFLGVGMEPVLRAEDGGKLDLRQAAQPIRDVGQVVVDRCRIADNPHPPAVEDGRPGEPL
jgi:hypothetical protein